MSKTGWMGGYKVPPDFFHAFTAFVFAIVDRTDGNEDRVWMGFTVVVKKMSSHVIVISGRKYFFITVGNWTGNFVFSHLQRTSDDVFHQTYNLSKSANVNSSRFAPMKSNLRSDGQESAPLSNSTRN